MEAGYHSCHQFQNIIQHHWFLLTYVNNMVVAYLNRLGVGVGVGVLPNQRSWNVRPSRFWIFVTNLAPHCLAKHIPVNLLADTSIQRCPIQTDGRKEGSVLFNDTLNTFYLRLYGATHMVKDHSDSERENPLPPHGLLFPINSKGSFICTIPQTG